MYDHYQEYQCHLCNLTHYSKTCLKRPLEINKTKVLKTDYRLMQAKSIAECSKGEHSAMILTCIKRPWSILQYFWPALSDIGIENHFWSSFEWPLKTGFTLLLN